MVILDAKDELLFVMDDCRPSILIAAELLFVTSVAVRETTLAANEADVLLNEEFSVDTREARDELVVVKDVSVVDSLDAKDELLFVTDVDTVSIRPAREDDRVVWVEPTVVIDAARDALVAVAVD